MNFPNLPGRRHANTRANLERACEELRYYAGKVKGRVNFDNTVSELIERIREVTPETANELFKQARQMCLNIEKILCSSR